MRAVIHGQDAIIGDRRGSFGSVLGYALECNAQGVGPDGIVKYPQYQRDPIEAFSSAVNRGHQLHWFNLASTVMTSDRAYNQTQADKWAAVQRFGFGEQIMFEGRVYQLDRASNNNVALTRVYGE